MAEARPAAPACVGLRGTAHAVVASRPQLVDDLGHIATERSQVGTRDHDEFHRRRGGDSGCADALFLEYANLAEELVGAESVSRLAANVDVRGPLAGDKELVGEIPLARQALPLRDVDLVGVLGDPCPLALVEVREQRHLLDLLGVQGLSFVAALSSATLTARGSFG